MASADRSSDPIFESKDAFEEAVAPHLEALDKAARRSLKFYHRQGHLQPRDLTPEEVVGETLIRAWEHRRQRPPKMPLRSWLLGTQFRVLRGLVRRQVRYRRDKAVSLDAPLPTDPGAHPAGDDVQEWFYAWYQPDALLVWEDVIPAQRPVDYEISLDDDVLPTEPDSYHVLMMHDEFEMALPEVAFSLGRTLDETAELLDQARATLHERMIGEQDAPLDHPTPRRCERLKREAEPQHPRVELRLFVGGERGTEELGVVEDAADAEGVA